LRARRMTSPATSKPISPTPSSLVLGSVILG
jgi:hypothetical protein